MKYINKVFLLSDKFYREYNKKDYPELLHKMDRPYTVLIVKYRANIFIAVPFRTNIRHQNGYIFSNNYLGDISGLDYSKLVVIKNLEYIGLPAVVNSNEFSELIKNSNIIKRKITTYITNYCNHVKKLSVLDHKTYNRRYGYSTLKYFHKELGL